MSIIRREERGKESQGVGAESTDWIKERRDKSPNGNRFAQVATRLQGANQGHRIWNEALVLKLQVTGKCFFTTVLLCIARNQRCPRLQTGSSLNACCAFTTSPHLAYIICQQSSPNNFCVNFSALMDSLNSGTGFQYASKRDTVGCFSAFSQTQGSSENSIICQQSSPNNFCVNFSALMDSLNSGTGFQYASKRDTVGCFSAFSQTQGALAEHAHFEHGLKEALSKQ
ncbi:hypothetical protein KP509_34G015300 [Ceratopteris richardii]|uniref:Uncharacterized protein n=1 Tax=Ceratopteris richardii TaxID=49495 RepID=A0A8T2QIW9_CERRI|nr:hypothetical protein KP509_34G015300 [Ceratopteris richardii]